MQIDRTTVALWEYQGREIYEWTRKQIETAVERVNRGALLLDKEKPDWEDEVLPANLDMSSATFCIIGQTYGNYDEHIGIPFGMGLFEYADEEVNQGAIDHGFLDGRGDDHIPFRLLDRVWVYLLTERRSREAPITLELPESEPRNIQLQRLADGRILDEAANWLTEGFAVQA